MDGAIAVNERKCTGCNACLFICSFRHGSQFAPAKARLRVRRVEREGKATPLVCRQCEDAACVEACPTAALTHDTAAGVIRLKSEDCSGCEACVDACSHDVLSWDAEAGLPLHCDLCGGRPACVEICDPGALSFPAASAGRAAK